MTETTPRVIPGYRKGRRCKSCGCAVGDRGRNSKTGDYFCGKHPCRLQRDAERQQRYRENRPPAALLAALPTREELRQQMVERGMSQREVDEVLPPHLGL